MKEEGTLPKRSDGGWSGDLDASIRSLGPHHVGIVHVTGSEIARVDAVLPPTPACECKVRPHFEDRVLQT